MRSQSLEQENLMHVKSRLTLGLLGTAAAVGAMLTPAQAAGTPAFGTMSVAPSTGLHEGDTVSVTGAGFPAGKTVYVVECSALTLDGSGCNQDTTHVSVGVADATGAVTALQPSFHVFTGTVGTGTCTAGSSNCYLVMTDGATPDQVTTVAYQSISFASLTPPAIATALTAKATRTTVPAGKHFAIKGQLTAAAKGINGLKVSLFKRANANHPWRKVTTKTTATLSTVRGAYKFGGLTGLKHSEQYRVRSAKQTLAGKVYAAATSKTITIKP
ncbi:MAG TPA: neocarzinostatin apoprotein domain-containing protein [Mycobacteriales bacterium]|nr:neocarzinostatin apoprotein domain-containing protein [Mycobacteriales bacterium]